MPVGILTYANLIVARHRASCANAAAAGADSLLVADVPALEAEPFVGEMTQAGLEPVLIAAANTPGETLLKIARLSRAYTYCVSRAGITGTHAGGEFDHALVARLNDAGAPPAVFGFGISEPDHVRAALDAGAAGVICGSAIVKLTGAVARPNWRCHGIRPSLEVSDTILGSAFHRVGHHDPETVTCRDKRSYVKRSSSPCGVAASRWPLPVRIASSPPYTLGRLEFDEL